ncbi:hypothetical protein OROGR_032573 [Orobanche gracilis]
MCSGAGNSIFVEMQAEGCVHIRPPSFYPCTRRGALYHYVSKAGAGG